MINHIHFMGDMVQRKDKKRNYKITFVYDENGKTFGDLLEFCFKEEMNNKKILKKGIDNDLRYSKKDDSIRV